MLASPRFSGRQGFPVAKTSGFTLIELLTVVAIIMIVAGIAIGVQRGVYANQANGKARGEIQGIATALERYKAAYGTYPVISNDPAALYNHLTGKKYHRFESGSDTPAEVDGNGQSFIDVSNMTTDATGNATPTKLVDPWGEAYVYVYEYKPSTPATWDQNFFILYSKGPNKGTGNDSNKIRTHTSAKGYFTDDKAKDDIVYGLEFQ